MAETQKIGVPEYIGEIADSLAVVGAVWDIWMGITTWLNEEINPSLPTRNPLMELLNAIHTKLSEIDDNVLASWATERDENIAFLQAHSTAALITANGFLHSGAARSDPEWAPKLALALRDSFVAVQTFTGGLESGFWLRPDSIKVISLEGDPTDFLKGWMQHLPDRAERHSFNRVWDYRWALPVALYSITARIVILRSAGEKNEIISQEIKRYINFIAMVTRKMESGIRSVGTLSDELLNRMANTIGVPIAVADIYGGYYLGGLSEPGSLKPFEPKAKKIPVPPFVQIPPLTFDAIRDDQVKFQEHWKNIVKERIGIGELFRFSGGLENILGLLEKQSTNLSTLRGKGIDFSVPEMDLLDWLNDPINTPYPAISEALLKLLGDKHLRKPVFLDVIVFKYEDTPGVESPRKLEDVDLAVLRTAVVDSYNERYGESVTDFQSLLL
ncbi:MAG: hypothetical protein ACRD8W_17615 [Nitrososphaeraceae archaeon]